MLKKIKEKFNNGVVIIIIGLLHTHFAFSESGLGIYSRKFFETHFYNIVEGIPNLHSMSKSDFELFGAFWFFYFGILLIILGLILFAYERNIGPIPIYFTISYLIFVLVGCYMIPASGMTYFMLPHAIFMIVYNYFRKGQKINVGT